MAVFGVGGFSLPDALEGTSSALKCRVESAGFDSYTSGLMSGGCAPARRQRREWPPVSRLPFRTRRGQSEGTEFAGLTWMCVERHSKGGGSAANASGSDGEALCRGCGGCGGRYAATYCFQQRPGSGTVAAVFPDERHAGYDACAQCPEAGCGSADSGKLTSCPGNPEKNGANNCGGYLSRVSLPVLKGDQSPKGKLK